MSLSDAEVLDGLPLLDGLEGDVRALVARSFVPVAFAFGETVVRRGDPADAFYVVAEGAARVLVEDENGEEISLNRLGPGDAFGEIALLEDSPRSATVRASSPLVVLRLDRGVFLAAVELHPGLRDAFARQAEARHLGDFLRVHSAFSVLDGPALAELAAGLTERRLDAGEVAIAQGEPADAMYLVQSGRLGVWIDDRRVRTLHAGDPFGELALVQGSPRTATVRAEEPVVLQRLAADDSTACSRPTRRSRAGSRSGSRSTRCASSARPTPVAGHDAAAPGLAVTEAGEDIATARPPLPRRFPLVRQIDEMDCGAACLAMVCRAFGHDVSLTTIRHAAGTSIDGTSLRGIKRGGEEVGLEMRTVKSSRRPARRAAAARDHPLGGQPLGRALRGRRQAGQDRRPRARPAAREPRRARREVVRASPRCARRPSGSPTRRAAGSTCAGCGRSCARTGACWRSRWSWR